MARLVSELGADVIDDTVVPSKVNKRKRNFIVGFSCLGVGLIALGMVYFFAVTDWLSDYQNMSYITYGLNIEPDEDGPFKGQVTAYISKVNNESKYPSVFKVPSKINGHPITSIGDQAFLGCNRLTRVEMSNNIVNIGDGAFLNCEKLESFKFSKNIEKIGNSAFDGTIYKESWKKNDVTYINQILVYVNEEKLLKDSGKDKLAFVSSSESAYVDTYKNDALVFDFDTLAPLGTKSNEIKVTKWMEGLFKDFKKLVFAETPEYLSSVSKYAFQNCTALTKVALNDANTGIGDYAFDGCTSFVEVDNIETVKTIGAYAFQGTNVSMTSLNEGVESVGEGAFKGCKNITSMNIPSTVSAISARMFENTNLSNITFTDSNNIASIGAYAFRKTKLASFRFPKEVNIVNDFVFADCENLQSIEFYESKITRIDYKAFYNSTKLHSVKRYDSNGQILMTDSDDDTVYLPSSLVNTINSSSGEEGSNFAKTAIKHVVIPNSLMNIAASMFENCTKLESITYESYDNSFLRQVNQKAFKGCTALTTFSFANTVRTIGANCFNGCTGLLSVHLPEYKNLSNAQIKMLGTDSRKFSSIAEAAFMGCTSLTLIEIPSTTSEIAKNAFKGCTALTRISIPENVKVIKSNAFADCSSSLYISVESASQPEKWAKDWNGSGTKAAKYVFGSVGIVQSGDFLYSVNSDRTTATIVEYDGDSTDLEIPSTIGTDNLRVTGINDNFISDEKLEALTSISIPDGLTDIGQNAFKALIEKEGETITTKENGIKYLGNASNAHVAALGIDASAENPSYKFNDDTRFIALAIANEISNTNNSSNGSYLASETNEFFALKKVDADLVKDVEKFTLNSETKLIVSNAFSNLTADVSIIIPNNIQYIANAAFNKNMNMILYVEDEVRPAGWDFKWNLTDDTHQVTAYWGTYGPIKTNKFVACENTDHTARLLKFIDHTDRESVPSTVNDGTKDYQVTRLGKDFLTNTNMTYLYIPSSVTKIEEGAFQNNPRLTIYCEAASAPTGYEAGWNADERPVYFGVNDNTYEAKENVDYVVVGDHVVVTGYNSKLTNVVIPETIKDLPVTTIGKSAFADNASLTSVVIPDSVTTIEENAFTGCESVKIYCEADTEPSTYHENWNPSGRPVYFGVHDENGLITIGNVEYLLRTDDAGNTTAMITGCVGDAGDFVVPATIEIGSKHYSVTAIGDSAFENATIKTIRLTVSNVTSIGKKAFRGSTLVGNVVLTTKVTFVGANAFEGTSTSLKVFVEHPFSSEVYKAWDEEWSYGINNLYVGLDLEWEYDENRNPVAKVSEETSEEE